MYLSYNQKRGLYTHASEITEIDIELTAHSQKNSPQARVKSSQIVEPVFA